MTVLFWIDLCTALGHLGPLYNLSFLCMCVCVYLADNCDLTVTEFAAVYRWWKCVIYRRCCCSATKLCSTLLGPTDYSTSGFPVLHYLLEFAQTPVYWVGDAIPPSHPLLPHRRQKGVINGEENERKEKQNYLGTRNNINTFLKYISNMKYIYTWNSEG